MTDDTPMDLTDEERQRVQACHVDPLAERLYNLMRKQPVTCCRSGAEDIATEVRAFLAERVTVEILAGLVSTFPKHSHEHPTECLPEARAVLVLLRREMGGA